MFRCGNVWECHPWLFPGCDDVFLGVQGYASLGFGSLGFFLGGLFRVASEGVSNGEPRLDQTGPQTVGPNKWDQTSDRRVSLAQHVTLLTKSRQWDRIPLAQNVQFWSQSPLTTALAWARIPIAEAPSWPPSHRVLPGHLGRVGGGGGVGLGMVHSVVFLLASGENPARKRVPSFHQSWKWTWGFPQRKVVFQNPPVSFHDCWEEGTD